ncbi:MAG: hypothetical protein ABJL44_18515 [Algibacter sp.]
MALIGFCALFLFTAIKNKRIKFNKDTLLNFILLSAYFLLLIISIAYSLNKEEAVNRIIQLSPLVIVPFILSFVQDKISVKTKAIVLYIFILANLIYTLVIFIVFLFTLDNWDYTLSHFLFDYDKFQFILNKSIKNDELFVHKAYFSMGFVFSAIFCLNKFFNTFPSYGVLFKILYLSVFIYFSTWVFYAFSFPNVIALLLSVLFLLYYKLSKKFFLYSIVLFSTVSCLFIIIKSNDIDVQRGINFVKSAINNQEYEVNDVRIEIYKSYSSIAKNSSLADKIFGFGVGDVQDKLSDEYQDRLNYSKSINSLYFTEEFDNMFWFKNNIEVVSNKMTSPDETLKAELVYVREDHAEKSHNLSSNIKIYKEGLYTFSVFAKTENSRSLVLRLGEINQRVVFNLENGTIIKKINTMHAGIKKLNDDWYRCYISVNLSKDCLALIGLSNKTGDYVFENWQQKGLYLWGAQLEQGQLTNYVKNNKELLQDALDRKLNTHNNYLFFLLAIGITGLIAFLATIIFLFSKSIKTFDILKLTFCIITTINFLTENILSRHWGLMFFSFMLIVLFSNQEKSIKE